MEVHLLVAALLLIQAPQAALTGRVSDVGTGAPLADAVVRLTDLDRIAVTDGDGRYELRAVPAGPQHVVVHALGYGERTLHALVPRAGTLTIDVALDAAPLPLPPLQIRVTVPVRGAERDDSVHALDRAVTIAAIRNHPLLAEPDALQALSGGEVVLLPESPSGIHVRGGAADHTAYLIDGIPVLSPYHAAGLFSAWNPDALAAVRMASAAPDPSHPESLSGAIEATTRAPGSAVRSDGSVGSAQARATVDGPVGESGAGWLLSARAGFPGVFAPKDEPSYVHGETADGLAKLAAPLLGGRLAVLGYASLNELDAAASAEAAGAAHRHRFEWTSGSLGARWTRADPAGAVEVRAWSAAAHASAVWVALADTTPMASRRRDLGVLARVERRGERARTAVGARVEGISTRYRARSALLGDWRGAASPVVAAAFVEHGRALGDSAEGSLAAVVGGGADGLRVSPSASVRWTVAGITISAAAARLHQTTQSFRNPESVVANVFPVDLHVAAGSKTAYGRAVPVARSDQLVGGLELRPVPGARIAVQAYTRRFSDLALVAPGEGGPFLTASFTPGSGSAHGVSVEGAVSAARYAVLGSYGWQRVRVRHAGGEYVPAHGAVHVAEVGLVGFPTTTTQLRVGLSAALGRRSTALADPLEWEACQLLDQGCEFSGRPDHTGQPLGGTVLPAYVRFDAGLRKHWHAHLGGRDVLFALFGSVTNVFARGNVLNYGPDPTSGARTPLEMRPLSPLVLGLDWRF